MKKLLIIAALLSCCIAAGAQEKRYEVKSGKVTVSNFGGQKMRMLVKDGSNIMVNDADRTATRMPSMGADAADRMGIQGHNPQEFDEQ